MTTKATFVNKYSQWVGSMALVAGATVLTGGCGEDMGINGVASYQGAVVTSLGDTLSSGETLMANQQLVSANGKYRALMQNDGNFVVYRNEWDVVWAVNEYILGSITGWRVTMKADGNLVVLTSSGALKWQSGSYVPGASGTTSAFLKLDDSGGLTVYAGTPDNPGEKRWMSKLAKYEEVAKKFRPVFNFDKDHSCNPLTFRESESGTSSHSGYCRSSFDSSFVVFANVHDHPDDRPNSFRITYGVAFGWQTGTTGAPSGIEIAGAHGHDAQYLVVDVVDDRVISVWADMHKGHYARTADNGLTMYTDNNVTAWAGEKYNSLKLLTDKTTVCLDHGIDPNISIDPALKAACIVPCGLSNSCGILDTVLNWGDYVGSYHENKPGKLVMTDDACAASTSASYVSADGVTYSTMQLKGLRNYIGCDGASAPWDSGDSTYRSKPQAKGAYDLTGCDSGDAASGGDICNATHFSDSLWKTSRGFLGLYLEPHTAGGADVDYTAGAPFNDIQATGSAPRSISIRTGENVKQLSVTRASTTSTHGGTDGTLKTISGLADDPVVSVELCSGTGNHRLRLGHIKFITAAGRVMQGGDRYDNCKTIAPSGKRFYGFYGRAGAEIDLAGTIWGDL